MEEGIFPRKNLHLQHSGFSYVQIIWSSSETESVYRGSKASIPLCYQIKTSLLTATLFDAVLGTETGFCRNNVSTRAAFIEQCGHLG